jgi:mono/diheme cytochrome c family protein
MKLKVFVVSLMVAIVSSCGSDGKREEKIAQPRKEVKAKVAEVDPMMDKGIGPIKSITLGEIDEAMVAEGKEIFKLKCSACHKVSKRVVGPAMLGITERRSPEWIMNMILNPEVMVAENAIAKKLLAEYLAPMANQNLTEKEARLILEYFRTKTTK